MLYLKSCPRCKGDMNSNRDMYGEYRECLNCGHMIDIVKGDDLYEGPATKAKKRVA